MADHYHEQRENEQMNKCKCPEIQMLEILNQLVAEAALALREFGRYNWQYVNDPEFCQEPTLVNAMAFLCEYEVDNWTSENLWNDILLGANAKEKAVEYMSECIAHWEFKALEKQQNNPWAHL